MKNALNSLGVRARLALGIIPLVILMTTVSVIVDQGFASVERKAADFEISAENAELFEAMEQCLGSSQRALLSYLANRTEISVNVFEGDVDCMMEISRKVAPDLLGSLRSYGALFQDVVKLTEEEVVLRDMALSYGPLALQTLTSIIRREARSGGMETVLIAATMKDKISESLFLLEAYLTKDSETSALEYVEEALDLEPALVAGLTSALQKRRAATTNGLLRNYRTRVLQARTAIEERSRLERTMLDVIAPQVARAISARTTHMRDRRSALGEAIGVSLAQTHFRVLLVTASALSAAALAIFWVGRWVSNAVRAIASLMSRIAGGEFDAHVPGSQWSNEFGEMARSLKVFQQQAKAARAAAETDPVTGLGNRRAIDGAVARLSKQERLQSSLALIDLNAFKPINDNFGHAAGDLVLKEIGQRLAVAFDKSCLAARLGGDEFGVLLRNVSSTEALQFAGNRLLEVFGTAVAYRGEPLRVSASIGIARLGDVDGNPAAAWKAADQSMFSIKAKHVKGFAIFCPDMVDQNERMAPIAGIRQGLEAGEFEPFFQPKFNLETGETTGCEVLARWRHPKEGIIGPNHFLGMIEKFGLVNEFTHRIFSDSMNCIRDWRDEGLTPPPVALNLHEVYLSADGGVDSLMEILTMNQINPEDIVLEITENILLSRGYRDAKKSIFRFSNLGFRIALDDFGTGFGSLRHLEELPIDEVKIDMSFLRQIGRSREGETIIECVINLAKGLNLDVVAEGVEKADQCDFLLSRGCIIGQGFLKSPAIEKDAFADLLTNEGFRRDDLANQPSSNGLLC